ncbi:lipase ZK262.3-like [Oculina patagonica]
MFGPFSLFVIVLQMTAVSAFLSICSDNNCEDCVISRYFSCRWCKRSNKCHMPGAILTNPCKSVENIVEKSHCDELSRYDPKLSMKMLYLSVVAYDHSGDPKHSQKCLDNSLPADNFQLQSVVTKICDVANDHDCSGYVAVSHALKVIVVAFRDSKHYDQAFAHFIETLVAPKTQFLDGEVQPYWKRGFDALWPSMEAEVNALVSQNPTYQIWVTGHSLGGAMASLASTWLSYYNIAPRKNIILYTFGMPRVGDYDYALQHDQLVNNSWRVVNDDDLVPHFPSVASLSIVNGPYHHGVEAFYTKEATSVNSPHKECHGKPYNEDITCSFSKVTRSIRKHKIYFSISVGTFWENDCVPETRERREESTREIQ